MSKCDLESSLARWIFLAISSFDPGLLDIIAAPLICTNKVYLPRTLYYGSDWLKQLNLSTNSVIPFLQHLHCTYAVCLQNIRQDPIPILDLQGTVIENDFWYKGVNYNTTTHLFPLVPDLQTTLNFAASLGLSNFNICIIINQNSIKIS